MICRKCVRIMSKRQSWPSKNLLFEHRKINRTRKKLNTSPTEIEEAIRDLCHTLITVTAIKEATKEAKQKKLCVCVLVGF